MVSGDSRNCGDVVMPEIAKAAEKYKAEFYWHLGDFRAIYRIDQDYAQTHSIADPNDKGSLSSYQDAAWDDFIEQQLKPFGKRPVYLALGNHELVPPKTRDMAVTKFSKWFDSSELRKQRERDSKLDTSPKAYGHWTKKNVDFLTLDNASPEEIDEQQMAWIKSVLDRDAANSDIRAIVVGMHEALPESIAKAHSMSDYPVADKTGKQVYQWLLDFKQRSGKQVYVLASHSHYYMDGIFQTEYWRQNGGVLPGWIIGTAGAERYKLPENWKYANDAKEHIYGYLVGSVSKDKTDPIRFEFHEIPESDVLSKVSQQYTPGFVHECWVGNPEAIAPGAIVPAPPKRKD